MITLSHQMRKLMSWPEFVIGYKQMHQIIVDKENAGDTSVTDYRIELDPPHQSYGQNFIILTHDPRHNCSIIGVNSRKVDRPRTSSSWGWILATIIVLALLSRGCT